MPNILASFIVTVCVATLLGLPGAGIILRELRRLLARSLLASKGLISPQFLFLFPLLICNDCCIFFFLISLYLNREIAFGKTKIFIRKPETVFALEELREQKTYNYATSIQNFFAERVGKGEYMYKVFFIFFFPLSFPLFLTFLLFFQLRSGALNAVKGQKDRRRESIDRKFKGDYIQYRFFPPFLSLSFFSFPFSSSCG